ncbi:MAG TPA: methylated-DNA--[protein]-cysteine S-methyltransferase [Acidimicrobiales bacterium]|nr:methylated-DNA--[protein]-cysteine S-methyltransferase [Acidimicrobiales bacterium]
MNARTRTIEGAGGDTVHETVWGSPIGPLTIRGTDKVLTEIVLPRDKRPAGRRRPGRPTAAAVETALAQLEEYFAGTRTEFDLPLALAGTPFQVDVWQTLADIPYGATVSYGELAAMVGRPTAFRAVGQANGANPIPIVLPCHRVLAAGGRIGGYGGGLPIKRQLLALEGVAVD